MSNPQSVIRILDVPLNNRYEHTYYFKDKAEQSAFFDSKVIRTFSAYSYIRKSWDLLVNTTLEQAERWNYLTFRNSGTGKDYYYFINQVEYVNDNNVRLSLEIDVMQTYMFDYGLRHCFVERQHTDSDKLYEHTIDEGLDVGDLINAHTYKIEDVLDMSILVMSTVQLQQYVYSGYQDKVYGYTDILDRVYFGLGVYCIPSTDAGKRELDTILSKMDGDGITDAIVGIWMYPTALIDVEDSTVYGGAGVETKLVSGFKMESVTLANWANYGDNLFGGYVPENNKLYSYPFNFLYLSNNAGTGGVYKYELFDYQQYGDLNFEILGAISPEANIKLCPYGYSGLALNQEEGITLGGYPTCAWSSDTYRIWLAQNQASHHQAMMNAQIAVASGAISLVGGILSGTGAGVLGGAGALYNGLNQVQTLIAQRKDMSIQPDQARGNYSTNVNVASGSQTFIAYYKCLTKEFAKQIDEYFNRYGYAQRRMMIPNIHARVRYTYVKTVGCLAVGDLCAEDMNKIMSIYDNGITFWDDKDNFGIFGNNLPISESTD